MFNINLAIKFGSNEIIIYRKGLGIVSKEPAYLAVEEIGKKIKVKATGKRAEKLFVAKSNNVNVYQPIVNSEIVDEKMAVILLSEILKNVIEDKLMLSKINALVAVPCALKAKQLRLLKDVLQQSGINKVKFVQNSVCARESLNCDPHSHIMIVDIGKYLTDISVLNEYNYDFGRMYYIGGQDMDKSISTFILDNHELEVTDLTSQTVKNEVASLYERDLYKTEYVGKTADGKFVHHEISANEVRVAIINVYDKIFEKIKEVLKLLPDEICKDICNSGVVFVGGSSSIAGLYEYATKKLDLPVIIPDVPADCVILGAGKLLSAKKEYLKIEL